MEHPQRMVILPRQWHHLNAEERNFNQQILFLIGGLLLLAFAQSLKFVIFIVFGLLLIPVAFVIMALAGYSARDRRSPAWTSRTGLFIFLSGLCLTTIGTWDVSMMALHLVTQDKLPSQGSSPISFTFLRAALVSIASSIFLGFGLYILSGKWGWKSVLFSVAALLTLPCTVMFFFLLYWLGFPVGT